VLARLFVISFFFLFSLSPLYAGCGEVVVAELGKFYVGEPFDGPTDFLRFAGVKPADVVYLLGRGSEGTVFRVQKRRTSFVIKIFDHATGFSGDEELTVRKANFLIAVHTFTELDKIRTKLETKRFKISKLLASYPDELAMKFEDTRGFATSDLFKDPKEKAPTPDWLDRQWGDLDFFVRQDIQADFETEAAAFKKKLMKHGFVHVDEDLANQFYSASTDTNIWVQEQNAVFIPSTDIFVLIDTSP
jgi:hypothetical protein